MQANTKADTAKSAKAKAKADAAKAKAKADAKAKAKADAATAIATERATAGKAFAALSDAVSVPIKTLAAFKRSYNRNVTAHAIGRKPSARQAAALTVAALAGKTAIKTGNTFPRKFTMRGAEFAIENGALSDCIASGLCTYDAASETVTIANAAEIKSKIGTIAKLAI